MAVVYKYRKANARGLDILRESRLWLSAPADFDDPSDMQIPIAGLFDSSFDVTFREMVQNSLEQDPTQRVIDVLKDTTDALQLGGLHQNLQRGMGQKIVDEVRQEAGVISFGSAENNAHLWENYADKEHGFCIGFETKILGFKAHPVRYINRGERVSLRYFESKEEAFREAAALIKYSDWKAEDEMRIILPRRARTFFPFDKQAVVKVLLGRATSTSFRRRVRGILVKLYPHAVLIQR